MGDHHAKTVIVVGAGASAEFGLPTGAKLKRQLKDALVLRQVTEKSPNHPFETSYSRPNKGIDTAFQKLASIQNMELAGLRKGGHIIADGMDYAPSIDNFLHANQFEPNIVMAGKIGITWQILESERSSTLFDARSPFKIRKKEGSKSWLHRLFEIIVSNKNYDEFLQALSNITFISFNYDRCIQQFFMDASQAFFSNEADVKSQVLSHITILYTYGSVGEFSLLSNGGTNYGIYDDDVLVNAALNGLKTFSEGIDSGTKANIDTAFESANNIFILGFGFIPLNMQYLFSDKSYGHKAIFCTMYQRSKYDTAAIANKLSLAFYHGAAPHRVTVNEKTRRNNTLRIENSTAFELIDNYSEYLAEANKVKATHILLYGLHE